MKYFITLTALLLLAYPAFARDLESIRKEGVLRVAADGMTPPFNYYKGKELIGFEVDLANEIAKRLRLKIEWIVQPFNTLLVAINQDRFDLIATSHAITEQRMKVVDFTKPHYCTGAIIVSKDGGPKTVQALAGKTVVVPVGTVYFDQLKKIPGLKEVRTVPNETDGLQNLLSDRADAWVTDQFVAFEAVKAHEKERIGAGEVIMPQRNAMVVSKNNDLLRSAIDSELEKILKDGAYSKLSKKYFERDIRCK